MTENNQVKTIEIAFQFFVTMRKSSLTSVVKDRKGLPQQHAFTQTEK